MRESQRKSGIPIYLDDNEPEIDDPAYPSNNNYWFPANDISIKLVACLESIRDIQRLLSILASQDHPESDKRIVKLLATPLYSFALGIRDILNDLQGNAKDYGKLKDTERQQVNKRLAKYITIIPFQANGALRSVRDKISSHVDKDVFRGDPRKIWELVQLELQLKWLRAIVDELIFVLSLDVYAWTRESGYSDVFRLMPEEGIQFYLNLEKKLILGATIARSPKYYISKKAKEVAALYSRIKSKHH